MSSQSIRQSEIFSGEDWTVLYRAFTQINFNAYDPASINSALRTYIQNNYPEDFNDWIESSEFVAIIDLLSWLAGSLAFRTDVNARENFLEAAEARESVLRLARFLSYTPRRAQSARGLVKITEVRTSEGVEDSFGVNLSNRTIKWNDADNPDWFEQFTLVLNATFPNTNPFGIPIKTASIGANVNLYRIDCVKNPRCAYNFQARIDGSSQPFEIVNADIAEGSGYFERAPDPENGHHIIYRNDGRGNDSPRTGFFMLFKQGTLHYQDIGIANPVENRLIDITSANISETDVWTQTLSSSGDIQTQWTKVPAIFSENITFNNLSPEIRNIFSVITRDNDQVALRFGDGRFGNVPVGDLRLWFRTVNGLQYQIRPRDMSNEQINIPYTDSSGRTYTLTTTFNLCEPVSNAVGPEDIDQIRRRAPQVYGTQNRMVSGEDYNVFPLNSNDVVKMRAVNRVYSGHSRFLDINDPTATLQDTVVYSDDGALYKESITQYVQVPVNANISNEQIVTRKIQPLLSSLSVRDFFLDLYVSPNICPTFATSAITWQLVSSLGFNSSGVLKFDLTDVTARTQFINYFTVNAQIKFKIKESPSQPEHTIWAKVISAGPTSDVQISVVFDEMIPHGAEVLKIIPPFRSKLDSRAFVELNDKSESNSIQTLISARRPFKLWYVYDNKSSVTTNSIQDGAVQVAGRWVAVANDTTLDDPIPVFNSNNAVFVMDAKYVSGSFWAFDLIVGCRFVFESVTNVRWNNLHKHKVLDATTGRQNRDRICVITNKSDRLVDGNGDSYDRFHDIKINFDIMDNVFDPDGYPDFRKVVVSPSDLDDDGSVDDPEAFLTVLGLITPPMHLLGKSRLVKFDLDQNSNYTTYIVSADQQDLDDGGIINSDSFGDPSEPGITPVTKTGVPNLHFQWKHYANNAVRIDPAITNIIDMFVMTREYDFLVRQWIASGSIPDDVPAPPSDLDLKIAFQEFEQYKMFSDQIIWRPVKYKYLFGEMAQPELKAQFKIVRLLNSPLSDGEIKLKVITAINNYFDVNKWEFGETFYFTELAAYIHLQLATAISSVVIVPLINNGKFGELFEIRSASNELFISTAHVNDVVIIDGNTMSNLRIS